MDMSLIQLWEIAKDREAGVLQSMGLQRVGHNWMTEQQHMHEASGYAVPVWPHKFIT